MSWVKAIDGSIEKWEGIRDLVSGNFASTYENWRSIKEKTFSPCPTCDFRDNSVEWKADLLLFECCDNCIVGLYFNKRCDDIQEYLTIKKLWRSDPVPNFNGSYQENLLAGVDDILTRLKELRYWVTNIRR